MHSEPLVRINKYSSKIKELPVVKRISVEYPLLCREEVAKKLAEVSNNLPSDLTLQIDSAYRSKKTQQVLWHARNTVIPGLVHDPKKGVSPHCTGGAIDVSLLDHSGKELNLSEPFIKYYEEPQLLSNKITKKAQELRLQLNKAMLAAGFAPNPDEYWHYSYGDTVWAIYTHNKAIYDEIELDRRDYFPFYKIIYYKITKRLWNLIVKFFRVKTNY